MRILTVLVAVSFVLIGCSSGKGTSAVGTPTGTENSGSYYPQNGPTSGGYQDYSGGGNGGTSGDVPSGVFPAIFGWDGRDYNVFLGLVIAPNNPYSACNPSTYGNPSSQQSLRNIYTFANPNSDISAYSFYAQHPPTLWDYDTNSGGGTFRGYVKKGAIDPDTLCGSGGGYGY